MVTVRLMGGLGNQLFQYAAARALAERHKTELRFDLSYLGKPSVGTLRHYELHHFQHQGRPLDRVEYLHYGSLARSPIFERAVARVLRVVNPVELYQEPTIEYDSSFQTLSNKKTVLSGRFQSPFYFDCIRNSLIQELQPSQLVSQACSHLMRHVAETISVGIHVRRTDYVNSDAYQNVISALPLEYYERAIHFVNSSLPSARIYIVSDDIAWCQKQDVFRDAAMFIDMSESRFPHIEEFQILRHCRSFIISNSTFAWWAAWLSESASKLVVAPRVWSHAPEFQSASRLPSDWVQI